MDSADGVCLSAPEYLRHRLTPAEAAHFATQGFLLIEDALAADQHWCVLLPPLQAGTCCSCPPPPLTRVAQEAQ